MRLDWPYSTAAHLSGISWRAFDWKSIKGAVDIAPHTIKFKLRRPSIWFYKCVYSTLRGAYLPMYID